jgi:hypothetical protein
MGSDPQLTIEDASGLRAHRSTSPARVLGSTVRHDAGRRAASCSQVSSSPARPARSREPFGLFPSGPQTVHAAGLNRCLIERRMPADGAYTCPSTGRKTSAAGGLRKNDVWVQPEIARTTASEGLCDPEGMDAFHADCGRMAPDIPEPLTPGQSETSR